MPARSKRKNFIYLIGFTAFFLLCAPFVILYSLGYDLGKNFSIFKTGGIYVGAGEAGVEVFVNGKLSDTTSIFQKGVLLKQLTGGQYNIRVAKEGYLDWRKNVQVEGEKVSEAYPFFIPVSPQILDIEREIKQSSTTSSSVILNPEYTNLIALFENKKIISKNATTSNFVENSRTRLEKEGSLLRVFWKGSIDRIPFYFCLAENDVCANDFVVYTSKSIGRFDFYPDRDDVGLVVSGNKLLAVEFDRRPPQNIFTLYTASEGKQIDFRVIDGETIVVKEDKKLTEIKLVYQK